MNNTSTQADAFGLHWAGPVAWLIQGRKGTNFVGLKAQCPIANPRGMCNHLVPTAAPVPDKEHWEIFQTLMKDPLVRMMLPIPHPPDERAFFVEDPEGDLSLYLSCLSRLSSPIQAIVKPAWMVTVGEIERQLRGSNIQPWVITRVDTKQLDLLDRLSDTAGHFPRTVLLAGNSDIPIPRAFKRVSTKIRDFPIEELVRLPLEVLGATVIRRWARKEDITADIESRDDRRNRMIRERSKP